MRHDCTMLNDWLFVGWNPAFRFHPLPNVCRLPENHQRISFVLSVEILPIVLEESVEVVVQAVGICHGDTVFWDISPAWVEGRFLAAAAAARRDHVSNFCWKLFGTYRARKSRVQKPARRGFVGRSSTSLRILYMVARP